MTSRSLLPLLFTIFLDVVGLGIAIPTLSIILLSPEHGILDPAVSTQTRSILYGFLIGAYPAAQFFGAPILGALSDRHGRKKLLLLSLLGTAVGYALFAIGILLESVPLLFASRLLDGFTGGNISIAQSAIADRSNKQAKARHFGLIGMTFGLGFILGPYLGGKFADPDVLPWFTNATPFWFAAVLTPLNMALLSLFFRETLHTRVATSITPLTGLRNFRKAFSTPNLRTLFSVVFLFGLGITFFHQFFQVYLIERFSFDQGDLGAIFGFIGLCVALAQGLVVRPVSHRLKPYQVLRFSLLAQAMVLPLFLLPRDPALLYAIIPFFAVFQGLSLPNATALVSNMTAEESQGEGLGLNQSVHAVAQIIPSAFGIIAAIHPFYPIIIGSLCILAAWIVFITIFRAQGRWKFHEV